MENHILKLGQTDFRDQNKKFGIGQADRFSHAYVLGQTGTGKTKLLEFLIRQDLVYQNGVIVLDPHGDMTNSLKVWAAQNNIPIRVISVANASAVGYNPIRPVSERLRPLLASGMLEVFKKLWKEAWGVKMEHIFRNTLLTLLDQPQATLADVPRILTDRTYRTKAISKITNTHVKNFWLQEFNRYNKRYINETIAPILNKVGGFLSNPALARFLTSSEENISLRKALDSGETLIFDLSKGELGEDASHLVGSLLITSIGLAAFSRADTKPELRRSAFLYVDEFQSFTTLSIINMASELRKYRLGLIVANQYLEQLDPGIRAAILGNTGSLICFRLGAHDANIIQREFYPKFDQYDLMNLENRHFYIRMMNDGTPTKPFSGETITLEN